MEYTGLLVKYPTQRELTEQERKDRLKQTQRLEVQPLHQLAVIKMNSTYLESVDRFFAWKGLMTLVSVSILAIMLYLPVVIGWDLVTGRSDETSDPWFFFWTSLLMPLPLVLLSMWLLRKDAFQYTHYPIRLNRKNRTVYAFRTNGTVLKAKWDELFFTLGYAPAWKEWDIRAHVLAADKKTVLDTFAFSVVESGQSKHLLKAHWEFLRRYVEDGPEDLVERVQFYVPVNGRKESFWYGWSRTGANFAASPVAYWTMWPATLLIGVFRWAAVCTSKTPAWPPDVEDESQVQPGDPYIRDATVNPPELR